MILRIVSIARIRCLPQKKQDIFDEPRELFGENWEPVAFDLYRRPSATISVFMGFDIATILLGGYSWILVGARGVQVYLVSRALLD